MLALTALLLISALFVAPAFAQQRPGGTERVSVASDGAQANNPTAFPTNRVPVISADGRYIAFHSSSTNLVPGDTNFAPDIFVHDRQTGVTTRVSVDVNGIQGNNTSFSPSISGNGRYVAFMSFASNLVPGGDANPSFDIFVHDRQTGVTEFVHVDSNDVQGIGFSTRPIITPDGRFVAFASSASNLVPNDNNGAFDIFVRDRQTGTTQRVSVASDGTEGNGLSCCSSAISADGRYVTYTSVASNLVIGDTGGFRDVFVHDRQTGVTTRVSVDSNGAQGLGSSAAPSISTDGRFVAFSSDAPNLVPGDTSGLADIFVHDRQTGTTQRITEGIAGAQANGSSTSHTVSADGRFIAFQSSASNLVAHDTNGLPDIFLHDRQTGTTARVSISSIHAQGDEDSLRPHLSADGRFVVFESDATNLVPGDTNGARDIFVHQVAGPAQARR
jgi:Tol biopolymer transport system component